MRLNADGSLDRMIGLPVPSPLDLAFGGPDKTCLPFRAGANAGMPTTPSMCRGSYLRLNNGRIEHLSH
ncbi:hypothetical protein [Pseudomonas sp. LB3P14]